MNCNEELDIHVDKNNVALKCELLGKTHELPEKCCKYEHGN